MIFNLDYINTVWNLLVPPDKRQPKWLAWGASVMAAAQWKSNAILIGYQFGAEYLNPSVTPATNGYDTATSYVVNDIVIYLLQAGGSYYGDNGVYQCISPCTNQPPSGTNVVPAVPPSWVVDSVTALKWLATGNGGNPFYWVQMFPRFIGAIEMAGYNCQKTIFEYALNKWFFTTFRQPVVGLSDIYITRNTVVLNEFFFSTISNASYFSPFGNTKFFSPEWDSSSIYLYTINIPIAVYNSLIDPVTESAATVPNTKPIKNGVVEAFANLIAPCGAFYNIVTY